MGIDPLVYQILCVIGAASLILAVLRVTLFPEIKKCLDEIEAYETQLKLWCERSGANGPSYGQMRDHRNDTCSITVDVQYNKEDYHFQSDYFKSGKEGTEYVSLMCVKKLIDTWNYPTNNNNNTKDNNNNKSKHKCVIL